VDLAAAKAAEATARAAEAALTGIDKPRSSKAIGRPRSTFSDHRLDPVPHRVSFQLWLSAAAFIDVLQAFRAAISSLLHRSL
jgi:plasmid stabilization system protein ParE